MLSLKVDKSRDGNHNASIVRGPPIDKLGRPAPSPFKLHLCVSPSTKHKSQGLLLRTSSGRLGIDGAHGVDDEEQNGEGTTEAGEPGSEFDTLSPSMYRDFILGSRGCVSSPLSSLNR